MAAGKGLLELSGVIRKKNGAGRATCSLSPSVTFSHFLFDNATTPLSFTKLVREIP
jgi:hypothetical protein